MLEIKPTETHQGGSILGAIPKWHHEAIGHLPG